VGQGLTNRDIAAELFIGEATVKTHLASIYTKLAVSSRHRAVARSLELGLLERRHGTERRAQARGLAADGVH
jgi:ATP/maltotriose-dependent transcriptional regulator MalT